MIGATAGAMAGQPFDPALVAALSGAVCSSWLREGGEPAWSVRYVVGTMVHMLLSTGAGLSLAVTLPVTVDALARVPGWALAFPVAACTHLLIPEIAKSVVELRGALVDRIRGRRAGDPS